jgi:Methyltransferase domain
MLEALMKRGLECYGVDSSSWAVERARGRAGHDRVFAADIDEKGLPHELQAKKPFGTILLWAVLEHFRDPFGVLEALTPFAGTGARLLINTTNALSLNRFLFDAEWEGYFDTSHYGVDRVSVDSLRQNLPALGWRVELLETHLSWDTNADPTHAVLREWWAADARFRRLLTELDRGDLVTCVAVRAV